MLLREADLAQNPNAPREATIVREAGAAFHQVQLDNVNNVFPGLPDIMTHIQEEVYTKICTVIRETQSS